MSNDLQQLAQQTVDKLPAGPWHDDSYRLSHPTTDADKRNGLTLMEWKHCEVGHLGRYIGTAVALLGPEGLKDALRRRFELPMVRTYDEVRAEWVSMLDREQERWEAIGRYLDELRQHIPEKDFGGIYNEPTLRPELLALYVELDAIRKEMPLCHRCHMRRPLSERFCAKCKALEPEAEAQ